MPILSSPRGGPFKFTGAKAVMFYYRLFDKNYLHVDLAIYGEYKLPRKDYKESEELEFKLIMEKDIGSHQIVLNPTFEKKVSGADVTEGLEFALNGAYVYTENMSFQPRLEYYSKMGELREINAWNEQKNYLFAGFDLIFGRYGRFMWHAGVGFGLSDPTDNVVIKSILSWGIFCDFCHTLDRFEHKQPFNHDYISHATEHEYAESEFAARGIPCQSCHMQPMGGKPAKMGFIRPHTTDHWFGGGFAEFVEGAAGVYFQDIPDQSHPGKQLAFDIMVKTLAAGHKFPTGSVEERDVWLHVSLCNAAGQELMHIPVPPNPEDPHDDYFITSNEKVAFPSHSTQSEAIPRDGLTEGDRLYHSTFLDSEGEFTFAQWLCVKEIENRLDPLEERLEHYHTVLPEDLSPGAYYLTAVLNYRRMPDPLADYFGIARRPVMEVSRDTRKIMIQ